MKPTDLRGILPYVPQFRETTFVVAIDGATVADDLPPARRTIYDEGGRRSRVLVKSLDEPPLPR